jgi:hypothetical protein
MKQKAKPASSIQVQNVRELSPYSKAIYEAGKTLLDESISTGREFCKFMVTICSSAIPIYLGILTFVLPKNVRLDWTWMILAILPALLFLSGTVLFVLGYLPVRTQFSLEILEEIEKARQATIAGRLRMIRIGFSVFVFASLLAISMVIAAISYL